MIYPIYLIFMILKPHDKKHVLSLDSKIMLILQSLKSWSNHDLPDLLDFMILNLHDQ